MIQDSIEKVDKGTHIANTTSESLDTMLGNVRLVTELIAEISESPQDQADAISQMSTGLGQVSQVVRSNSSTAEESAATSQELNSQVEVLHNTVSFFKF